MKCEHIEQILPGYLDDAVSKEERRLIDEHMSGCDTCREAMADLKRTLELAGSMEEVKPPVRFTQEIMARVRQEAAKEKRESFLQRLFSSFKVNIPLQAIATVFVLVLAFYLFRSVGPEVQKLEQQKTVIPDSVQVQAESLPAPVEKDATMPEREKASRSSIGEIKQSQSTMKAKGSTEAAGSSMRGMQDIQVPSPQAYQESGEPWAEARIEPRKMDKEPTAPGSLEQTRKDPGTLDESISSESKAASSPALRPAREQSKSMNLEKGFMGETMGGSAPADESLMKKDAALPTLNIILSASNIHEAVKSVENILSKLNAHVTLRQMHAGRAVLVADIKILEINDYILQLGTIGKTEGKVTLNEGSEGTMSVRTEIRSK